MSEQAMKPISSTPTGPSGHDEVGRFDRARNNADLAAYKRTEDAYDASAGAYDIQALSYSTVDSYNSFDTEWKARNNVNTPDTTEFYRQNEYMDKRWTALADATVQRYLDLMNDRSGKVTFAMKLEIEKQSLYSGESDNGSKGKALNSFEILVQEYLDKGTTAGLIADPNRFGSTAVDRGPYANATALRREIVDKMISAIALIEKQFQPPTPGKKEADALMKLLGSETLFDGAIDRFSTKDALLF